MQGTQFDPWSWKILHAMGQLSTCSATTEPVLRNKRNHCKEKPADRKEE